MATNGLYALFTVPIANHVISHKEKYTEAQRFRLAYRMIDHMRRCSRTATRVYGMENIPREKGAIFYSNHQGKYDALGILLALNRPCGVLWEKKQANRLLSKQVCRLLEGVDIDLTDMRDKVRSIHRVTDAVKGGRDFLIFPEGGYTDNHNMVCEFKGGSFKCAQRAKAPIVPVAIINSWKAFESKGLGPVETQVHFLPPLYYDEYKNMKTNEIAAAVQARIQQAILDNLTGKDLEILQKQLAGREISEHTPADC